MIDDLIQKEEYLKDLLKEKGLCESNIRRVTNALEKNSYNFIARVEIVHSMHGTITLKDECVQFIEDALKQALKLYSDKLEECNRKLSKIEIHL